MVDFNTVEDEVWHIQKILDNAIVVGDTRMVVFARDEFSLEAFTHFFDLGYNVYRVGANDVVIKW